MVLPLTVSGTLGKFLVCKMGIMIGSFQLGCSLARGFGPGSVTLVSAAVGITLPELVKCKLCFTR